MEHVNVREDEGTEYRYRLTEPDDQREAVEDQGHGESGRSR